MTPATRGYDARMEQPDTRDASYAERLTRLEGAAWKRLLDVQRPYRWNLQRQHLGRTLDVGCGIGRNLQHLDAGSVGVDHNADSVRVAGERGLTAYTPEQFEAAHEGDQFESLLMAHVLEHLDADGGRELLRAYLPWVRPGGKVFLICPQERGYASDATHVTFLDIAALRRVCADVGLDVERSYSFPLPRAAGRVFTYNEFCVLARTRP